MTSHLTQESMLWRLLFPQGATHHQGKLLGVTSFSAMRRSSRLLRFSHLGMAVTLRRATSGWARRPANSTARCCRSAGSSTESAVTGQDRLM